MTRARVHSQYNRCDDIWGRS